MNNPESSKTNPLPKKRLIYFNRRFNPSDKTTAKISTSVEATTPHEKRTEEEYLRNQEMLEFFILQKDARDQSEQEITEIKDSDFALIWQELQKDPRFQNVITNLLQPTLNEETISGQKKETKNWLRNPNHPLFVTILENIYHRTLQEKVNAKHVRDQEKTPLLKKELEEIIPESSAEQRDRIINAVRQLFVGINPEDDVTIFEASLDRERKYQLIVDTENQHEGLKRALFRFNSAASRNKDHLTGAWNRHAFENYLEVINHQRQHATDPKEKQHLDICGYAITTFDFDHFKQINDTYGHTAGDEALQAVTTAFQEYSGLRSFDFLFRQGGDEWALIMPLTGDSRSNIDKTLERIIKIFRDISQKFVDLPIHDKDGQEIAHTITFSAGSRLIFPDQSGIENIDELKEYLDPNNADTELYQAKGQSRNRITLSYTREDGETMSRSVILNQKVGAIS